MYTNQLVQNEFAIDKQISTGDLSKKCCKNHLPVLDKPYYWWQTGLNTKWTETKLSILEIGQPVLRLLIGNKLIRENI